MEIQERGKKIVLASGRPTDGVEPGAGSLGWRNMEVIFFHLTEE